MVVVALFTFLPGRPREPEEQIDFDRTLDEFEQRRAETLATLPDADRTTTSLAPLTRPTPASRSSATPRRCSSPSAWQPSPGADRVGEVLGDVRFGCSVSRFEANRFDVVVEHQRRTHGLALDVAPVLDTDRPDIAQLVTGAWKVPDARLPGGQGFSSLGDPAVDLRARELRLAVDTLAQDGAMVLLVLWPQYGSWADGRSRRGLPPPDRSRPHGRLHELLHQVAAQRPTPPAVLDFAGWFGPRVEDRNLRADGLHISEAR